MENPGSYKGIINRRSKLSRTECNPLERRTLKYKVKKLTSHAEVIQKKKKPYNLRSQKKLYGSSTPKSKVDACVECDLMPFDESEIAPELRRERSSGEREISGLPEAHPDIADRVNETNLLLGS